MVLFPEVQKKGQAELDAVFGGDQLPTWADRERLPYVDAVIKEVLRWAVVAPQGLPRCALEDFEYEGYLFEKGTIMVGNTWCVLPMCYAIGARWLITLGFIQGCHSQPGGIQEP